MALVKLMKKTLTLLGIIILSCAIPRDNPYDPKNPDYQPLRPPANITGEVLSDTAISIQWQDDNSLEDGYAVKRSQDSSNFTQVYISNADARSYIDAGLTPKTKYFYQFYAFIEGVDTAYADTVISLTTTGPEDLPLINGPVNLNGYWTLSVGVRLVWEDSAENETGYLVERSEYDTGNFIIIILSR